MTLSKTSKLLAYISYRMRVTLSDNRQMVGKFMAFDRHMNLVLGDCEEFRKVGGRKDQPEREERRVLGLVLVRGEEVISITLEGPPPPEETRPLRSQMAAAGPGSGKPMGRGLPAGIPGQPPPGLAGPAQGVGGPIPGMMMPRPQLQSAPVHRPPPAVPSTPVPAAPQGVPAVAASGPPIVPPPGMPPLGMPPPGMPPTGMPPPGMPPIGMPPPGMLPPGMRPPMGMPPPGLARPPPGVPPPGGAQPPPRPPPQ
eukprot:TRINITY_DN5518_c0_g1_i2.p2 TRINITY_DN5518_c0_g1~~TRINITY_DN5518_c0_g1_i2.p2  ORF type:complete len:254 (-),score=42.89 TRINITY_DN5518_c0_g1_i2:1106-1867(-)